MQSSEEKGVDEVKCLCVYLFIWCESGPDYDMIFVLQLILTGILITILAGHLGLSLPRHTLTHSFIQPLTHYCVL